MSIVETSCEATAALGLLVSSSPTRRPKGFAQVLERARGPGANNMVLGTAKHDHQLSM